MRNTTKLNAETGVVIDQRGQELAIIDIKQTGKVLPLMNIDVIQKILRPENVKVLSTVNAHRLLRWEIQTVTKQFVEGMVDARAFKVYGGYQELANRWGVGNSKKAAEQLRDIIVWQAAPRFYQPNGRYGNMLSFDYTPSVKGRPAILQLVLGNMMLPHYVYELHNMPQAYVSDRRLIPIVDMPPLIGRANEQGTQPSYQIEILVEMRKGAKEFATNGCVLIPKNKLEELAEKAALVDMSQQTINMSVIARRNACSIRLFLATCKPSLKNAKRAGILSRNSSRENLKTFYDAEFFPTALLASIAKRANMTAWLGFRARNADYALRVFLDA